MRCKLWSPCCLKSSIFCLHFQNLVGIKFHTHTLSFQNFETFLYWLLAPSITDENFDINLTIILLYVAESLCNPTQSLRKILCFFFFKFSLQLYSFTIIFIGNSLMFLILFWPFDLKTCVYLLWEILFYYLLDILYS